MKARVKYSQERIDRLLLDNDQYRRLLAVTQAELAFVLLGGSTLKHWATEHYLRSLNRREVHIYDSDVAKYAESVTEVNLRKDGSWSFPYVPG